MPKAGVYSLKCVQCPAVHISQIATKENEQWISKTLHKYKNCGISVINSTFPNHFRKNEYITLNL